jgi:hypothetical protein
MPKLSHRSVSSCIECQNKTELCLTEWRKACCGRLRQSRKGLTSALLQHTTLGRCGTAAEAAESPGVWQTEGPLEGKSGHSGVPVQTPAGCSHAVTSAAGGGSASAGLVGSSIMGLDPRGSHPYPGAERIVGRCRYPSEALRGQSRTERHWAEAVFGDSPIHEKAE